MEGFLSNFKNDTYDYGNKNTKIIRNNIEKQNLKKKINLSFKYQNKKYINNFYKIWFCRY